MFETGLSHRPTILPCRKLLQCFLMIAPATVVADMAVVMGDRDMAVEVEVGLELGVGTVVVGTFNFEAIPFGEDVDLDGGVSEQECTGINFDAYEHIPVETSGSNVPPPVGTFAEVDIGDALNLNIRRCKFVKPTPVQRYAIPISLAGRDLMACAQTASGKTAAFCFPIISGIMQGQFVQRPRNCRTAFPLALILSPTRELY